MSPALETPPPMTIASGSVTAVILASALPRISPNSSTISFATSSPSFAASKIVFALSSSLLTRIVDFFVFSSLFRPILTIPVAEQYCSRQPFLPQPQVSSSCGFTGICPISAPAPCEPFTIFPLMMRPPPTPVPSVTISMLLNPRPPPFHCSPSAAAFASLTASTLMPPSMPESSCGTLTTPQPRLTQLLTIPPSRTGPGTSMPIPRISEGSSFFSLILSLRDFAMSGRIFLPFSSVLVGISHFSRTSPFSLKRPSLTVVPPRSMPNAYFPAIAAILRCSIIVTRAVIILSMSCG